MASRQSQGPQPTPQQMAAMQQQIAVEAQKRGMTPQQFQLWQRQQLEEEARKAGLTFEQYINQLKQQAFENHQRQQAQQQQQQQSAQQQQGTVQQTGQGLQQQGQQVPVNAGTPDPKALALAKFLRAQELKTRTCILNGQRKDMFRVKRALRAIESPAYTAACQKKNSLLPAVSAALPATEIFKLLPLSILALRVTKTDPHEGHGHAPPAKPAKRTKGLWHVRIEQQQDTNPDLHYAWIYEGPQWRTKAYAGGALAVVLACVMHPLWPMTLRLGVWYLTMGMGALVALFFVMAFFRIILFLATVFTVPPGLWLYPNLFEDVGFFDSFRPVWGWQESKKKKKISKGDKISSAEGVIKKSKGQTVSAPLTSTGPIPNGGGLENNSLTPRVEEVEEED